MINWYVLRLFVNMVYIILYNVNYRLVVYYNIYFLKMFIVLYWYMSKDWDGMQGMIKGIFFCNNVYFIILD